MLDPRLYRVAFVPALLALLVAAFSISERPAPVRTTLAPDTFMGTTAMETLERLAARYPSRRPGSEGDHRLAAEVASELRRLVPGTVEERRFTGRTIDGRRELVDVIATRPGQPGPGLVVVAHRDAVGEDARAELSGTAALLELARVAGSGRLRRTVTFISTSGGTGGFAGAREEVRRMTSRAAAVIVLGDMASAQARRPFVIGASDGLGQAPIQLQRTLDAALRVETGADPGSHRWLSQWLRMAVPVTIGEQGPFLRGGQPAVLVSASGERPPDAGAAIRADRLQQFGRAVLRALHALDDAPPQAVAAAPTTDIVVRGKVLPGWAVRMVAFALLLPALIVAVDALARLRRRGERVGGGIAWTVVAGAPLVAGCGAALLLGTARLLDVAPGAPIPAPGLEVGARELIAAAVLILIVALMWTVGRSALLRAFGARPVSLDEPGVGVAVGLTAALVVLALWVFNPYAAALLLPAVHLWLWATAPETGLRRWAGVTLILVGLLPLAATFVIDARAFGWGPVQAAWGWVLLVAGGHIPVISWLLWSLVWGCAVAALIVVVKRPAPEGELEQITVRGPVTYAGPGSLGGTESALRR